MSTVVEIIGNDADVVEITANDIGDNVLIQIFELGAANSNAIPFLEDLTLNVGGAGPYDPVAGVSIIYLPPAWDGKRLRVIRNNYFFDGWSRQADSITLTTPGDVTVGPDGDMAGDKFVFQNY